MSTAKLISSCHCWSKWEYVRVMQTCMCMQGNGEESTLNMCKIAFFGLFVFELWSQQEDNSVIKSTLTVAQSATALQRAARLKAMTVPLSVSCSSGNWQVTQLTIYSEGSFNSLFHYVTFNGAMAVWNSALACFFNTIHDTYVHSRSNYHNPTLCTQNVFINDK